jgi:hypothetical protein
MTEAQYSRWRKVSRVSVMRWKQRGNIVMRDDKVDVVLSDAALNERPESYRGGRKSADK